MNTKGNFLTFKTYQHVGVNESEITFSDQDKKDFYLESSKEKTDDFKEDSYGISGDLVSLSENKAGLYRLYKTKEDSEILDIALSEEYPSLIDIHDLVIEPNEEIDLVINYDSKDEGQKFRSSLIRVHGGENSKINLHLISMDDDQTDIFETIYAKLDENASLNLYEYRLGGRSFTSNTKAELLGDESSLNIESIYFAYGENKMDMQYDIIHHGEKSKSDLMVNGAMKDNSFKKFKSTLDFLVGSSKSDGSETENVILLSEEARAISVPVLLSGEDDVAGNHAASAGRLNDDMIFYLMSRGLEKSQAESLVINSRFAGAIDALKDESHKEKIWNKVMEIMK